MIHIHTLVYLVNLSSSLANLESVKTNYFSFFLRNLCDSKNDIDQLVSKSFNDHMTYDQSHDQ